MDKETENNIKEVIKALAFCDENGRKCKKCKEKDECTLFLRSSISVCLNLLLSIKGIGGILYT